jgi:hypothetical protein
MLMSDSVLLKAADRILCYAIFDNQLSVVHLSSWTQPVNGVLIVKNRIPNLPVHFMACTIINGHFYAGITAATPTTGSNYIIKLAEADPAAFKASLNKL